MMSPGGAALETVVWIIVAAALVSAVVVLVIHLRDRRAARSSS